MVAASKKSAGLAYGTSGIASTPHIAGEAIRQRTGAKLMHVPYRGGSAALADVLGNSIPLVFTAVASAFPYIKTGKLVALAVSSAQREPSLPDVPTMIQSGLADFDFSSWVGVRMQ
jgi:tripartite-type tricarboxylate transporter receptor subunit TctC